MDGHNVSSHHRRSTGPALFAGVDAIARLWVFWLAPIAGALVAGASYALLVGKDEHVAPLPEATEA